MMFDGVGKDFALQVGIYKSQVGLKFKLVRIRSETIGNLRGQAMMRDLTSFVVFLAMVIGTAVSKPLWSTIINNNDVHSTPEINAQYLAAYQDTRSPYYVYNIYTNAGGIPSTIHVSGKPEVSYVPAYNLYYGTPIYDLRIPLNPIYPVLTPSHPGVLPPVLPPTSTQQSFDDDYDGIEKLDTKVDPATETKKPGNSEQDDDSITVEAI